MLSPIVTLDDAQRYAMIPVSLLPDERARCWQRRRVGGGKREARVEAGSARNQVYWIAAEESIETAALRGQRTVLGNGEEAGGCVDHSPDGRLHGLGWFSCRSVLRQHAVKSREAWR